MDVPLEQVLPGPRTRERMFLVAETFLAGAPFIVGLDVRSGPSPDFILPKGNGRNSLLHIVTETEMSSNELVRVSGKVLKPIVALQPFIIVGNPHSLQILRNMGFRTFGHVFDESYVAVIVTVDCFDVLEGLMHRLPGQDTATLLAQVWAEEETCVITTFTFC